MEQPHLSTSRAPSVRSSTPGRRSCVVTGAAGFIGSKLAATLVDRGWDVVGIDGFTDSYDPVEKRARASVLGHMNGVTLVEGDLVDMDLEALFEGAEVVFHLAGRAGVRASFDEEPKYVHDNVLTARAVVAAARRAGVRRAVYASSSSVYGNSPTPFAETAPPAPISPYGRTKLEAERTFLEAVSDGLEAVALRYFTVYGPGQRPDMGLRIFAEAALRGEPLTLLGDGTQRRDFTYVDDIVSATIAAADAPASGLAINVGGGSSVTLLEVLELLRSLVAGDVTVQFLPPARGDVRATEADASRAASLLGFRASVPFQVGFPAEVAWVRDRVETMQLEEVRSA